jgi:hypothetical protein
VSIPVDTYFVVTPASQFISKSYASLNGTDLFIYVNETNELRIVNMNSTATTAIPGTITYTLALNTKWVRAISVTGTVYIYYADLNGVIWFIPYTLFGGNFTPVTLSGFATAITFSAIYTPQSNPPAFIMLIDDGIRHNLYVASDPKFTATLAPPAVAYSNALDTNVYLNEPSIAMHPSDTARATVTFQQTVTLTSATSVGFYEVVIPGVM